MEPPAVMFASSLFGLSHTLQAIDHCFKLTLPLPSVLIFRKVISASDSSAPIPSAHFTNAGSSIAREDMLLLRLATILLTMRCASWVRVDFLNRFADADSEIASAPDSSPSTIPGPAGANAPCEPVVPGAELRALESVEEGCDTLALLMLMPALITSSNNSSIHPSAFPSGTFDVDALSTASSKGSLLNVCVDKTLCRRFACLTMLAGLTSRCKMPRA
mmetsp:Transcript_16558/g.45110  ORF Transcript_16558/g.45110 Transcript_16558/m.45110 type:complete len:218 (-) Transcript_16558:5766-6419(-)